MNDPTTAVQALDQIEDLLMRLAFDEILVYGAGSVQVMRRLRALLSDLIAEVNESRRAALKAWADRLNRAIARAFPDIDDRCDASVEDQQGLGVPRARPSL